MKIFSISGLLLLVLLLNGFNFISCRRADCSSGCTTAQGSISLTANETLYTYDCFRSASATDANHYVLTFGSCSNPGCNLTITLGYFNLLSPSSLPITINSTSPSQPYVEIATNCPQTATGITTQGLTAILNSYTGGILNATLSGTTLTSSGGPGYTITSGTFSFNLPSTVLGTGGSGGNCTSGYIDVTVNGVELNMTCGALGITSNNVAEYGYTTGPSTTPVGGINFQILEYSGLILEPVPYTFDNTTRSTVFGITCTSCPSNPYTFPGANPDGSPVSTVVTITSMNTTTISGTILGNIGVPLAGGNWGPSVPIQGTFSIPYP